MSSRNPKLPKTGKEDEKGKKELVKETEALGARGIITFPFYLMKPIWLD